LGQVTIGEDDVGIQNELINDLGNVVILIPLILTILVVRIFLFGLLHGGLEGSLHQSVFTHDHLSVDGSEFLSQFGDLLGGDVISVNKKSVLVLECKGLELSPEGFLLEALIGFLGFGHFVYWMQIFYC